MGNASMRGNGVGDLLDEASRGARDLERMRISAPVQAEILVLLTRGRRTMSEMTEEIFGVRRSNPSYHTYYMRVSRGAKALQRRGYVARGLLGRDKPYRLTPFALAKMIDKADGNPRILPTLDATVYVLTMALGASNVLFFRGSPWLSRPLEIMLYTGFVFLAGFSLSRLVAAFRRVS